MSWIEECMSLEGENVLMLTNDKELSELILRQIAKPISLSICMLSRDDLNRNLSAEIHQKIKDTDVILTVLKGDYEFFRNNLNFRIELMKTMKTKSLARWGHMIGIDKKSLAVIKRTNYQEMDALGLKLGEAIANSKYVEVIDERTGANLMIENTDWTNAPIVDNGIITGIHSFGTYPAGEVCIVLDIKNENSPRVSGKFVADASMSGKLLNGETVEMEIERNIVSNIEGGNAAQTLEAILSKIESELPRNMKERVREVGEIGFGINPLATFRGSFIEDEKTYGSVHIAIGTNIHLEGKIDTSSRETLCSSSPIVLCDGLPVIEKKEFRRLNLRRRSHMNYDKYMIGDIFDNSLVINKGKGLSSLRNNKLYRKWPMPNGDFRYTQVGNWETNRIATKIWKVIINSSPIYLTVKDISERISFRDIRTVKHVLSCMEFYGIVEIQNPHTPEKEAELMLRTAKNALGVILEVKPNEKVLIVSDISTRDIVSPFKKAAAEIGISCVHAYEINERDRPLEFVPKDLEAITPKYDVFINMIRPSVDETPFRVSLVNEHELEYGRVGHAPGLTAEMMTRGPMSTDYVIIAEKAKRLMNSLKNATEIEVTTPMGTVLKFSIKERSFMTDVVIRTKEIGNFPMGEIYVAPIENSANGTIIVDGSISDVGFVSSPVVLRVRDGEIESIESNQKRLKQKIEQLTSIDEKARVIGEFGIGLNPGAAPCGHSLLDEKAGGTAHVGFGNNLKFKHPGKNNSRTHRDFIFMNPTIIASYERGDRKVILLRGEEIEQV